jgi:hypothetical protein
MRSTIGQLVLAAVLFAAGFACWAEARVARRVADAHARLVTLHYDADDQVGETGTWLGQLPLPLASLDDEVEDKRTIVRYWRAEYGTLRPAAEPAAGTEQARAAADPDRMFVMANASFRTAQQQAARVKQSADRLAAVAVLDGVMQSYAEVMRADPSNADAAYNFEYLIRFRDSVATGKPTARTARQAAEEQQPVIPSLDLPVGPTIHGRPGAPPEEIPGDQFRTIAPMPYDEREQSDPGVGVTPQRKG